VFDLLLMAGTGLLVLAALVTLGLHWRKRAKQARLSDNHPEAAPDLLAALESRQFVLAQRIDSFELTQSDLLDKFNHYVRRERVRKLREAQPEPTNSDASSPGEEHLTGPQLREKYGPRSPENP